MSCNKGTKIIQNIIPEKVKYFKEEAISERLVIPSQKPDIERILNVLVSAEVEDVNLVDTEVGMSNEGQNLTGYKLVVELKLKEKVIYVADEDCQSVHSAHYESMKSIFVILPKEYNGEDVCDLVRANRIQVNPYIEATKACMLDERTIHKCVLLLVDVKFC